MFGPTEKSELQTKSKLNELNLCLTKMINSVEKIEQIQENLKALPNLERLVLYKTNIINPIEGLFPSDKIVEKISYDESQFNEHIQNLDDLLLFSKNNINIPDISSEIKSLKDKLFAESSVSALEFYNSFGQFFFVKIRPVRICYINL